MSDQPTPSHDTQSARWLKYGSNTVVVCVVVVVLGAMAVYLAERKVRRVDTTAAALYSLKPQTIKVISSTTQPIQITSFYSKAKPGQQAYGTDADDAAGADSTATIDRQADIVSDLLAEYAADGKNITVETIDPKLQPAKTAALIDEVSEKFGGQVDKYKAFAKVLNDRYDAIDKEAAAQLATIQKLPLDDVRTQDLADTLNTAIVSVRDIPKGLKKTEEAYQTLLHQKPPDYKKISDTVTDNMTSLSAVLGLVIDDFRRSKDDKAAPPAVRKYMADSVPAYQAMKKRADDLLAEAKGLGELKLDTLREALHQDNSILVRTPNDWKVIRYDQVWKSDARDARSSDAGKVRPRFAGEQMITTAILALNNPVKAKVCFVRGGGEPLGSAGGQFSSVADRLRDYNFDVTDKDLSGQYAMQAMQQQQQMAAPEPTDADVDDAVWIVYPVEPPQPQNPMMGGGPPPSVVPQKLADHLANGHHYGPDGKKAAGGTAMFLAMWQPQGAVDPLEKALGPFGLRLRTDAVAVHPLIKTDGGAEDTGDEINSALKYPPLFMLTDWGSSVVTDTIRGLPGVLLYPIPVQLADAVPAGVHPQLVVPVPGAPDNPPCWGETDLNPDDLLNAKQTAGDLAAPLSAGGLSERPDGSRLMVVGSGQMMAGADVGSVKRSIVDYPVMELYNRGTYAPRFPGDAELFMNGVFWLTHQEPMIAISPAAMTVSRIGPMTKVGAGLWHVGVLLIGLPGLVLAAGAAAYVSRRD